MGFLQDLTGIPKKIENFFGGGQPTQPANFQEAPQRVGGPTNAQLTQGRALPTPQDAQRQLITGNSYKPTVAAAPKTVQAPKVQAPKAAAPKPAGSKGSLLGDISHDITHNPVTNGVGDAVKFVTPLAKTAYGLGKGVVQTAKVIPDTARTIGAEITNNGPATDADVKRAEGDLGFVRNLAQGIPRAAVQLGESLDPYGSNVETRQITPKNGVEKFILGKAPINSMQYQYQQDKAQHGAAYAAGDAYLQAVMDVLGGKQLASGVHVSPDEIASKASALKVSSVADRDPQVAALSDHLDNLRKADDNMNARGMSENSPARINNAKAQIATLKQIGDRRQAIAQGGYAKIPGKAADDTTPKESAAPPKTAQVKASGLTKQVKNSPEFSDDLKAAVSKSGGASYNVVTDKATQDATGEFMKQPLAKAKTQALADLAKTRVTLGDKAQDNFAQGAGKQAVSNAGAVMKALDEKGDYKGATEVHDALASKLTEAGQTSQAASLIYNRTPEGLKNVALSQLRKAGVTPDDDLMSKVNDQTQAIKDADAKGDVHESNLAKARLAKTISSKMPSKMSDKVFSTWRTGILSAPITAVKVGVVNPISSALETVKDIPASAVDKATSLVTGKRTVMAPDLRQTGAYLKTAGTQGLKDAGTKFKENITAPGSSSIGTEQLGPSAADKGETNFGVNSKGEQTLPDKLTGGLSSKIGNTYVSLPGRVHGAITTPFYEGAAGRSLVQQAEAEAVNQGLKGADRDAFIKDFVANPSKQALANAEKDAQYATSQQRTALGTAAGDIAKIPGGRYIAPITRIPGGVATQVINYSPVGLVKTAVQGVIDSVKNGDFDQRTFSQGMGRGMTGTGIMYVGYKLAQQGRLSGAYPSNPSQQALWTLENKPANSLYVGGTVTKLPNGQFEYKGGTWEQIGSAGGPGAQSLLTGGAIAEGTKRGGALGGVESGVSGGAQIVTDQPYLTGVSGVMNAVNNPDESKSFYDQEASSVVPNFLRSLASATDPDQRQTSVQSPIQSAKNAVTNGIPGLREKNQPEVDVFGNTVPRETSPAGTMLNPFKPQKSNDNALIDQLASVEGGRNAKTGSALSGTSQIAKKYNVVNPQGKNQPLTDAQRTAFIQNTGQKGEQELNNLIQSSTYKNAPDAEKSKMISSVMSAQRTAGKDQVEATGGAGNVKNTGNANVSTDPTAIETKAQTALDKDSFENSGKSEAVINGNVYQKDKAGNVTVTPLLSYQYSLGEAELTSEKDANNLNGWLTTANSQLNNIAQQLKSPNLDQESTLKLQNEQSSLEKDIAKYEGYGGFTESSGTGSDSSTSKSDYSALKTAEKAPKEFKAKAIKISKGKSLKAAPKAPRPKAVTVKGIRLKKGDT